MENEEKIVSQNETTQNVSDMAKETGRKAVDTVKEFSQKDFGKFNGKHILIAAVVVVVLIVLSFLLKGIGNKEVEYAVVYNNSDSDLYLMGTKVKSEEKAVKLSSSDSVNTVVYANTTDRYVLFEKSEDLYIYDAKKKDETTKLVKDIESYYFTENDKYVVALNNDNDLYAYNFKKDAEKIESDVSTVVGLTDAKVVYVKDDTLYIRSLNAKKDDKVKIADDYSEKVSVSLDGKTVTYINDDKELISFNVAKESKEKIESEVSSYYCGEKDCSKMYYVVNDGEKNLYFYNGKKATKIASDIYSVNASDVDNESVVYSTVDNGEYSIYFVKSTKDAAVIEEDLDSIRSVRIFDGKEIYYLTKEEVKYAKINGNKVSKPKEIADDVSGYLTLYKNGYAFVSDVDKDDSSGTLCIAKNGKVKEIDKDVNTSIIKVSNNGKKIYYMKDYKSGNGDLYVTSGSKGKEIDKDVHSFTYVTDKVIYYVKDYSSSKARGDLYRYTGKSVKLAEEVTRIASTPNTFTLD